MAPSLTNRLFTTLLAVLALTGCPGSDDKSSLADADEDGYTEDVDCDEANAAIHPGAEEVCDEVDNDCDYAVDNNPTDGRTFYADNDGDTYGDADNSLAACSKPTGYVNTDTDCDDGDATISPIGTEICDDVDNDCNGLVDDSSSGDGAIWYLDADGDGYGNASSTLAACDEPAGYTDNADDCDDSNADYSPEADERCDTFDNDCDGLTDESDAVDAVEWYLDADEDGYGDPDAVGKACTQPSKFVADDTDCDDDNASAYPGATEEWHDSEDYDCDGKNDPIEIWVDLEGGATSDKLGVSVDGAGDVDGDGMDDAIVGATGIDDGATSAGGAYLFLSSGSLEAGGNPLDLTEAECLMTGVTASDAAGAGVAGAGDVDGDGYDDLIVGANAEDTGDTTAGAVYLVLGTTALDGSELSLADADLQIVGINSSDAIGSPIDGVGDVNDDGLSDIIVGVPAFDRNGQSSGSAWILFSNETLAVSTGLSGMSGEGVRFDGEGSNDKAGAAVSAAGDVDGDGLMDVVVGAYMDDTEATSAGEIYVLLAETMNLGANLSDDEADFAFSGTSSSEYAGSGVGGGGDVNGDGLDDLVAGGYGYNSSAGVAWVLLSNGALRSSGASSLSTTADVRIEGAVASDQFGYAVAMVGDTDGDTLAEVVIGAPGDDTGATGAGAAWVLTGDTVLSSVGGTLASSDCDTQFVGSAASDAAGSTLAGLGDINDDGRSDMVIGAPSATTNTGLVWFLRF